MRNAARGDTVIVHYIGMLENGTVFDFADGVEPSVFQLGEGQVISGFEEAVLGMEEGERKVKSISTELAYGKRDENLVFTIQKRDLPEQLRTQVARSLEAGRDGGVAFPTILSQTAETITLDANHPLAGMALSFEITLVRII